MTTTPSLRKVRVEYLAADKKTKDGKAERVRQFVLTNMKSFDEAIGQARERAETDGFEVQSANFRANENGELNAIVVYVKGGKR